MVRLNCPIRTGIVTALVAVSLLLVAPAQRAHADSGPGITERMQRDGEYLVDEHGRIVLLRGANQVWKGEPWVAPVEPGALDDTALSAMAAHGWNVVRLGVYPKGLMPTRGVVDETYLDLVAEAIDAFASHGIYVLLDVHQDIYSGFPDWMVPLDQPVAAGTLELLADSLDLDALGIDVDLPSLPGVPTIGDVRALEPDLGFPLNGFRPSMMLIWDSFWGNDHVPDSDPAGLLDHTADMVAALAARIADHPAVVGIEILNESNPGTTLLTCFPTGLVVGCPTVDQVTQSAWQKITDAVRTAAGDDVMLWWEPNVTWNFLFPTLLSSPPLTPAVTDPAIGLAFHDYCIPGELATYLGTPDALSELTCSLNHDLNWEHASAVQDRTGWPLFVTEFGNSPDPAEAAMTLAHADAHFAHWVQWTNGITDRYWHHDGHGDEYASDIIRQYARTYPMATAGTPQSLGFDAATGTMVYRYRPADLGAPTEIAVSDVHYPDGYEVTVTGGRVLSAPGAVVTTPAMPSAAGPRDPASRTVVAIEADAGVGVVEVVIGPATASNNTLVTPGAPPERQTSPESEVRASGSTLPITGGSAPLGAAVATLATAVVVRHRRRRAHP